MSDSFIASLDQAFYKAYPDEWGTEGEFYIRHEDYTAIINGERDNSLRERKKGETVTGEFIERDGYHLWEVGQVYIVKHHSAEMYGVELSSRDVKENVTSDVYSIQPTQDGIIGKLKLVAIKPGSSGLDTLVFEVVEVSPWLEVFV